MPAAGQENSLRGIRPLVRITEDTPSGFGGTAPPKAIPYAASTTTLATSFPFRLPLGSAFHSR